MEKQEIRKGDDGDSSSKPALEKDLVQSFRRIWLNHLLAMFRVALSGRKLVKNA